MPRVLEGEQIYVYVPQATSTNAGIASYKNADFKVNDSVVSLRWPIQSIVQGPLATPSLIKVQDTEFEYSNANVELEYEGSAISSTVSEIQIKRDLRDAYNRPDLVMLDPNYFVRTIVEKDGKQYYKYNTTAVHYNMSQKLSDNEQAQARLNIGAGSLAVVEQSNKNASEALLKASSAEQTSAEALEIVKTSDAAAKEAVVIANRALTNSGQAITTADTALANSGQAITAANTALDTSNSAISTANVSLNNSSAAVTTADSAKLESNQAITTAESANAISAQARDIAQNALDLVTEGVGSQVLVNGESVSVFNADTKADVTYVNQKIDEIIGPGSTEAIDTIMELADAFKNNSDIIKVLNESISTKANKSDVDALTETVSTKANSADLTKYLLKSAGFSNPLTGNLHIDLSTGYVTTNNNIVLGRQSSTTLTPMFTVGSDATNGFYAKAGGNNSYSLGTLAHKWSDLYLAGSLKDGTNSVMIKDIVKSSDLANYIPQGGTLTAPLKVTGGDQATSGKIILDQANKGQITNTETATLFGFNDSATLNIGHANYNMSLRGKGARPKYQNKDMALVSDALPNFTITISHQSAGNPRMVKFVSVNYSSKATCFKMAAMTCHDNGVSYQFLTDMLIAVTTAGEVTANIYKFAQREIDSVDGVARYTGDVFYVNDTTNKIVDFYILCGQWSASQFTPVTKVGSTTIDYVTQYSGNATYYSSGTKTWVNGCGTTYARLSDLNNKLSLDGSNTMTGVLNLKASGANETNIGANGIRWNLDSLPQSTTPEYVCVIDGFAVGGRQKWSTVLDVHEAMRKVVTPNWHVSQDGSGNLVFSYA